MLSKKELCGYVQEAAEGIAAESSMDAVLGMLRYVDLRVKPEHGSCVKDLITVMVVTPSSVESPARYGAYTAGDTVTLKFWVTPPVLSAFLGALIVNDIPYILGMNGTEYARHGEI